MRFHYDFFAPFYYLLWGEHVHHGFWDDEADQTPKAQAQERLMGELYTLAGCPNAHRLLDVGCGYGGALRWFEQNRVPVHRYLGMTLSPVQQAVAQAKIARAGLSQRARVTLANAEEHWPVDDGDATLVWCFEMAEHLSDRAHLAREAFRALQPGGTLCLAAWLAGDTNDPGALALRERVARDTVGHSFSTASAFETWLRAAGFANVQTRLVTPHVVRTWDIAQQIVEKRPWLQHLARRIGGDVEAFVRAFPDLRQAFATRAMEHGLFVARKPTT